MMALLINYTNVTDIKHNLFIQKVIEIICMHMQMYKEDRGNGEL